MRWRRMAQDEALWVPGTDHAGIATQNVVERLIAKEGKSRFDLGREAFLERVTEFVTETGGTILEQLRAIGSSCDWSRTAYTLLAGALARGARGVRAALRGWTDLSRTSRDPLVPALPHIAQRRRGRAARDARQAVSTCAMPRQMAPVSSITVATTRPETIPGDVAVAVNPQDERYRDLVGTKVLLPLVGIEIPVIADDYVDAAFGTGALKITPAHDPNDFEVGRRHKLPTPVVIDQAGFVRDVPDAEGRVPAELAGLDRFEARDADRRVAARLRRAREDRGAPEQRAPLLSMRDGDRAAAQRSVVRENGRSSRRPRSRPCETARSAFSPSGGKPCTSTGSRTFATGTSRASSGGDIAFRCGTATTCGGEADREPRGYLGVPALSVAPVRQDEDVLDTWFSSWLWPISTLGWPNESSPDLRGVLSDRHARHRAGDPLLLGRAHDHGRLPLRGPRALSHRVSHRHRARHAASQDVQVARQRHRSARRRRALRRRCAALHGDRGDGDGRRRDARSRQSRPVVRDRAQLRHEALEHRTLPADERGRW